MKVRYNKGMGYPVEISDGKTATCISLDTAKKLQASLLAVIEQAETPEEEMSEMEIRLLSWLSDDTSGEIPMERMKQLVKARAAELLSIAREQFIKNGYVIEKKAFHDAVEKIDDKHKAEMSIEYSLHCKIENGTRHAVMNWKEFQKLAQKFIDIGKADALKDLQENLANNDVYSVPEWLREVLLMTKENGKKEALKDLPRWKKCDPHTIYDTKCNFVVNGIGRYIILDGYMIDVDRLEKLPGFKEDESHE